MCEHTLYPDTRRAWLTPTAKKMNTQPGVGVLASRRMKHPDERRLRTQPARIIQRERKGYLPIPSFAVRRSIGRVGAVTAMMLNPVRGEGNCLTRKMYIERFCKWQSVYSALSVSE
jgi:hypothetical protein